MRFGRFLLFLTVGNDAGVGKLLGQVVVTSFDRAKFIYEKIGGGTHRDQTVNASSSARIAIST